MKEIEKALKIEDGVLMECDCEFCGDLVIPDSVTKIGCQAFCDCDNLTSVVISDSVTEIENFAFENCKSLIEVTIGKSVKIIGAVVFYKCSSLKTVNYNATECVSAGFNEEDNCHYGMFAGCPSLTTLNIGANVISFPDSAFWTGGRLSSVHYDGDIASWCKINFGDQDSNPLSRAHNLYINDELLTDLVVPDSITQIENFAFAGATCLKSVLIPDSVTSIGCSAFFGCTGLTALAIPSSVTCIMSHAFSGCSRLADISSPESIESIGESAFLDTAWYNNQPDGVVYMAGWCLGCKGDALAGSLSIQEGTKGISPRAFFDFKELTSVSFPDSVADIGDFAFLLCNKLNLATLGKSLAKIGIGAFAECYNLTEIVLPDSLTEIGNDAFSGCKKLKSVALGKSILKIGDFAFYDCCKLADITIPDSVTEIGRDAFCSCGSLPAETKQKIQSINEEACRIYYGKWL